jgi:spore germination protein GerM
VRKRLVTALALLLTGLVAAGCAIPTQGAPVSIAPSKVPFNLLNPHLPTTTTTQPKPSSFVAVKVFFLDQNSQLSAVDRYVASPAQLTNILDALMAGPDPSDVANGFNTAIPSDVAVLSTTPPTGGKIVTVNMNSAFGQITGTDSELAVGQIVATVAAENGFGTGVLFEIDGQRTSVPTASGAEVDGPVYLIQFLNGTP